MLYCLNPSCPNPVNPPENRHCQHCGDRLALRDRFIVLRPIGQGGFGKTYLAQDQDNRNKLCVVKRFTYVSIDPQSTQKAEQLFEQEAERLDQLLHPQIPRLLAYFQEGDYLYLVQEFVVGKTLQEELAAEGKFSEAKIRAVLQGLLPILKFIHSRKVIHRDLKPDNIMRRQTGELVLIDFGVAKLLEQSGVGPDSGSIGTTIGTPGYAAPEQIQGRVSPASDLFALGATCFQLLTKAFTSGQLSPVEYDWVQRWQQHADPNISPELKQILSRLITVDDRQRYPTATAVLKALNQGEAQSNPLAPTVSLDDPFSEIATVAVSPGQPSVPVQPPPPSQRSVQRPIPIASQPPSPQQQSPNLTVSSSPNPNPQPFYQSFLTAPPSDRPLRSVPISGVFWLKYGVFSIIGDAVGFAIAMVAAVALVLALYGNADGQDARLMLLFSGFYGFVGGGFISVAQWLSLKKWLAKAGWWIPITTLGFAVGTLIGMNVGTAWFSGLIIGGLLGCVQWAVVLRSQTPRAHWWILWIAFISAMTFRIIGKGEVLPVLSWFLIAPLLEGFFLTWLLRSQYNTSTPNRLA